MRIQPGTRLGPYEVERLLGAGGMGEVYLAHDTRLRRDVAIKVLPIGQGTDDLRPYAGCCGAGEGVRQLH